MAEKSTTKKATKKRPARKRSAKKRPARNQSQLNYDAAPATRAEQQAHQAQTALARKVLETRRKARNLYKEAEGLLDELVEQAGAGAEFDLGKGRTAIIIDNFARRRTQFKRVGFDRFDLDVLE